MMCNRLLTEQVSQNASDRGELAPSVDALLLADLVTATHCILFSLCPL